MDLNYIVDYRPALFFAQVEQLVEEALAVNAELLSLFVSALDPADISVTKYPAPAKIGAPASSAAATSVDTSIPSSAAKE